MNCITRNDCSFVFSQPCAHQPATFKYPSELLQKHIFFSKIQKIWRHKLLTFKKYEDTKQIKSREKSPSHYCKNAQRSTGQGLEAPPTLLHHQEQERERKRERKRKKEGGCNRQISVAACRFCSCRRKDPQTTCLARITQVL